MSFMGQFGKTMGGLLGLGGQGGGGQQNQRFDWGDAALSFFADPRAMEMYRNRKRQGGPIDINRGSMDQVGMEQFGRRPPPPFNPRGFFGGSY